MRLSLPSLLALLFSSALSAATVSDGPGEPLDLWQLYLEARDADPRILRANALHKRSEGRQREAYGQLLPQLNGNGSFNRSQREDNLMRSRYNGRGYALGLSQLIYAPQTWRSYQKFSALTAQSSFEYEDARIQASIDLAERYFTALAAEDELSLILAELHATERNHARSEALFARKLVMVTDVLELAARLDLLKAKSIEASNQLEISRESISELVGRTIEQPLQRLSPHPNFTSPHQEKQFWVDAALQSNPALQAKNQALEAAQAALAEAKAGHLPTLALDISAQRTDIGYEGTATPKSDTYIASLGVRIPLYSGGSTQARVSSLYAELDATQQEYEALRRQIIRETRTAYLNLEASLNRIKALQLALESAETSRAASEKAFAYGVMNAVDVLDSIGAEFRARRDLLQSQYNFITNLLVLHRWSGQLNDADIRQVNAWLVAAQ